jgi:DNA-directed RNA polymerase specialized sigma24 family protein
MKLLDRETREKIVLAYKAGVPVAEIATVYHTSKSTVCILARRAGLSRGNRCYASAYTHLDRKGDA